MGVVAILLWHSCCCCGDAFFNHGAAGIIDPATAGGAPSSFMHSRTVGISFIAVLGPVAQRLVIVSKLDCSLKTNSRSLSSLWLLLLLLARGGATEGARR